MQTSDELVRRPPHPASARTWPDFTAALRELFAWCGRPKYSTVSKASGLAPSNISNLIGKNPLQRPSESAALRFVGACLTIGGYSSRAVEDSVEEWRQAWLLIDSGDPEPGVPPSVPAPQAPARQRRPIGQLVLAAAIGALSVVLAGVTWVLVNGRATADPKLPGSSHAGTTADQRCQPSRISPIDDVRTGRSWSDVLVCPNVVGAAIRLEPTSTSPVVGTLDYDSSWFVCWTRGDAAGGDRGLWYYTKGDSLVAHPEAQKWGYVPVSDLTTTHAPDVQAIASCPR